jgi:hypothetical protein
MAQRLTLFLERVLLAEVSGKVVIFIDEIDTTLSLPFADDFFAVIRHLYNARVQVPEFRRLSFVLLGVATPNDLIKDPSRTPFNIGQSVELTDFTIEEAAPLANGLSLPPDRAREVLGWILDWTGGHPYLTQRLCRTIAEMNEDTWTRSKVDDVVTDIFLNQKKTDHNLRFVADMLTVRAPNLTRVLKTYREIYRDRAVPDDHVSSVKSHLKLSGVVISEQGILRLRNAIYRKAFDENWIEKHLPTDQRLAIFASVMVLLSIFVTVFTTVFDNMSGIRYIGIASSIVTLIFSILAMVLGIRAIRNI